jgi:hypothetical protein
VSRRDAATLPDLVTLMVAEGVDVDVEGLQDVFARSP